MQIGATVQCRKQAATVIKRDIKDKDFEYLLRFQDKTLAWVPRKALTNRGASK